MRLAWLIFGLILINVLRNALSAIRSCLLPRLGEQITFDMRRQVYRYLHRLSLNFYNDRDTGRIMASVTHDFRRRLPQSAVATGRPPRVDCHTFGQRLTNKTTRAANQRAHLNLPLAQSAAVLTLRAARNLGSAARARRR